MKWWTLDDQIEILSSDDQIDRLASDDQIERLSSDGQIERLSSNDQIDCLSSDDQILWPTKRDQNNLVSTAPLVQTVPKYCVVWNWCCFASNMDHCLLWDIRSFAG